MKLLITISSLMLLIACNGTTDSTSIRSTSIYSGKYRELANALKTEDTMAIATIVKTDQLDLNFADSVYGVSLLNWCIFNEKVTSFKKLLELGADVNLQDVGNHFAPPIIQAAQLTSTSKFLELALFNGGNVNQMSRKLEGIEEQTVLLGAVTSTRLESVQMVVEKGADINLTVDSFWTPLAETFVLDRIDMSKYLLEKGAYYNDLKFWTKGVALDKQGHPILDSAGSPKVESKRKLTILDFLRELQFSLDSKEYQIKMEVVNYLKSRGLDYWAQPIPEMIRTARKNDKNYLDKY